MKNILNKEQILEEDILMKEKLKEINELMNFNNINKNTPERFRELLVQVYTKDKNSKENKENIKWSPEKVFLIVPTKQEYQLREQLIDYLDKHLYKDLIQEIKDGVLFDNMKELSWIKVTGFTDEIMLWQEPEGNPFYKS